MKYLDLSTSHLEENDCYLLDECSDLKTINYIPLIVYKYPEGYFVYCGDSFELNDKDLLYEYGFSKQFQEIFKQSCNSIATFIRFDCDGFVHPSLQTFEW
jgi:hypothetical protein